jgi:tetratricopeptide (TPR) repeat protein
MSWPRISALERQINELMDRLAAAGDDPSRRVAVLEEYLALAYAQHDTDETFDIGAYSEDLADCYLTLDRVDEAVATVREATAAGYGEGAVMLCELAEKLMRSGEEVKARPLWEQAHAEQPGDVWVYVQAGIEYAALGEHATALGWLTPGLDLALRTGDPDSAIEQLHPLRAAALSALGQ